MTRTFKRIGICVGVVFIIGLISLYNQRWNYKTTFLTNNLKQIKVLPSRIFTTPIVTQLKNETVIEKGDQELNDEKNKNVTLPGYVKFDSGAPLSHYCSSCAYVSSSGQILGKEAGDEINNKECVIRNNNAPYYKFEKDVGNWTDVRVLSHTSVSDVTRLLKTNPEGKEELNRTLFVVWGPLRNMKVGGRTNNQLKSIMKSYPNIKLYVLTNDQMDFADFMFEVETGKPRMGSGAYLSTGWFTFLLMKEICGEIHAYGVINEGYCEKLVKENLTDAPYHYYAASGAKECGMYFSHERAKRGGHRYITEKRVFKKWADEKGLIFFHSPEWS